MARGRNISMGEQHSKDAQGTFESNWASAWLIGMALTLVAMFLVRLFARRL